MTKEVCSPVTETVCNDVTRTECVPETRTVCDTVTEVVTKTVTDTECETVTREECQLVPETVCRTETREKCEEVITEMCRPISEEVCDTVPREKCDTVEICPRPDTREVCEDQEERSHSCLGSCPLCDWPTLSTERSIFRFSLTVFLRRQKAHFLRRDFNRRSCGRLSIPVTNKADSRHKMRSIARERKPHIRVTLDLLLVNLTAKMTNIERVENAPRL